MRISPSKRPSDAGLPKFHLYLGVSINGGSKNGWFIMENPSIHGWFGGTPISGNLHLATSAILWHVMNYGIFQALFLSPFEPWKIHFPHPSMLVGKGVSVSQGIPQYWLSKSQINQLVYPPMLTNQQRCDCFYGSYGSQSLPLQQTAWTERPWRGLLSVSVKNITLARAQVSPW